MPKRNLIWVLAIAACAVITAYVTQNNPQTPDPESAFFRPVVHSYQIIKDKYYRCPDDNDLRCGAVQGMVGRLDQFSKYVPPEMAAALNQRVKGVDCGLGLKVEVGPEGVTVIGPIVHSPAERGNVQPGDTLLAVNGKSVKDLSQVQVERLLDGANGQLFTLTVQRGEAPARQVEMTAGEYHVESLQGLFRDATGRWVYLIDPEEGTVYIRITEFLQDTPEEVQRVFRELPPIRQLVLDLRDNPGGELPAAVEVAGQLLRGGTIATLVDRSGHIVPYTVQTPGAYTDGPLAVLTNGRTASAAELVAGALSVNDRAVLVGTRTYGKGVLQSMITLPGDLGQVNLTTAEFLLPGGQSITRMPGSDQWGIDPHDEVVTSILIEEELRKLKARAMAFVPRHPTTLPATMESSGAAMLQRFMKLDPQLTRALALTKVPAEMKRMLEKAAVDRARLRALATQAAATRPK